MRNIKLKGGILFKVCSFLVICVVFASCCFELTLVDQPYTATVGEEITVKLTWSINGQISGDDPVQTKVTNGVLGILAPKGWNLAENATITYTSSKGDGRMKVMDPNLLDSHNPGYNYSQAMMLRAGRLKNLINDVEWVPFMTENTISYSNNDLITGTATIKMKVAADGNDTKVQLGYMFANTLNGIDKATLFISDCPNLYYYAIEPAPQPILVTGGTTGDFINFWDPQYSFIDPPKSLDNDFVTINFDSNAGEVPSALLNADKVYFCGKANLEDGGTVDICADEKSVLKRVGSTSIYKLTVWPRAFFGIQDNQKIVSLEYFITDKNGMGGTKVGLNNTDQPFIIKFKCN